MARSSPIRSGILAAALLAFPAAAQNATDIAPIYTSLIYPEGPVFDGDALLFTDMKLGAVLRWNGSAAIPIWQDARCGPTSLAKLPSGLWLVACHLSHQLVFLDMQDPLAPREIVRVPFRRPNDMYAGRDGVYVTRSGEFSRDYPVAGEVWLVRAPDDMRRVASGIHYANGVAVTRDGRTLLVCEHLERRVWRYPILPDGSLGERTLAYSGAPPNSPSLAGPDGIEPVTDGSFFVAYYWTGTILHVGPRGTVLGRLAAPGYLKLTNIALTPDGHGLYAVASSEDETKGALFFVNLRDAQRPPRD